MIGQRTNKSWMLFCCLDCRSFVNSSNYQEDDLAQKYDFNFLINKKETITAQQNNLFHELNSKIGGIKSVLEIGSGIGLFLKAASYYGVENAIGYEINPYASEYAQKVMAVKSNCKLLGGDEQIGTFDLICAIGVLEHLRNPRQLFSQILKYLSVEGYIYISVPFFERMDWKHISSNTPWKLRQYPDPLHDNDVHITHFSIEGLKRMGTSLGARNAEYFISRDVVTNSAGGAYPGILFAF